MPPIQWGTGVNRGGGSSQGDGSFRGGGGGGRGQPQQQRQQQGQNYNQYNALSKGAGDASRKAGQAAPDDPWTTVARDFVEEIPLWTLSCYSHKREGINDLTGDVSFEEARWKHYQERAQGKPDIQLVQEFRAALATKDKELRAIKRVADSRQKLPSLGGVPIHEPCPWRDSIVGRGAVVFGAGAGAAAQPKTVFGTGFGAPSLPPPPPLPQAGFGAAAAPVASVFGQPSFPGQQQQQQQQTAAFGMQPGGGVFGQPAGFGAPQQLATGFGQPAVFGSQPLAAPAATGAFGAPAASGPIVWGNSGLPNSSSSFQGVAPKAGFAQGPAMLSAQTLFGQPAVAPQQQQQQQMPMPPPQAFAQPGAVAPSGGLTEEELMAYRAPAFMPGKIPDKPPPPELCS